MANIKELKYKLIKNFFSNEELNILKKYCINKLKEDWTTDPKSSLAPSWYQDALMNSMLENKLPLMEKETGLKLFKTYAFWRYYVYGCVVESQKDKKPCEISVTACIHKTQNWPLHIKGNWIEMEEGDGIVYLGHELEHERKPFEGDGCAQVFMHYVDQNGSYAEYKED